MIPINQYGFRPGFSTNHQLIDLLFEITNCFNDEKLICLDIIFLDLSNAFDSISFSSILEKCHSIGIQNNCLKILEKYLFNRKQTIFYENNSSKPEIIASGVPQGGVGSPDLFKLP